MTTTQNINLFSVNGFVILFLLIILGFFLYSQFGLDPVYMGIFGAICIVFWTGFFILEPNESRVVTFFGKYIGTKSESGFHWTVPLTAKPQISLKTSNINTEKMKVNDAKGNPIEIGAVVVWKVIDPYKSFFGVDFYRNFVATQCESAVRELASLYPYDGGEGTESLRGNQELISEVLKKKLNSRLDVAGVIVIEARISHLAYAPEIAQAMLRRQQAEAVISARKYIVENALVMVEEVIKKLEKDKILKSVNEKEKISMINNLLVALVSETSVQPVVTTNTSS